MNKLSVLRLKLYRELFPSQNIFIYHFEYFYIKCLLLQMGVIYHDMALREICQRATFLQVL